MDIKNLKYFVGVARCGSINKAAKEMFISQPQLSHIIQTIEEEVGFALIQHTSQGSRLTQNGESFLQHCKVILNEMDSLDRFVTQVYQAGSRLAVSMTRFSHTAACFNQVCENHQNQENLFLRLHECSTMDVIDEVSSGFSEIGVLHFSVTETDAMMRNFESRRLQFIHIARFRPYVFISANHELLRGSSVTELDIHDLMNYGFVRYIGEYEDFFYHIKTPTGVVDLNESSRIIFVNDRAGQMRLISETNYYTIGIPEFEFQDALYDVVSVPLKKCSDHICFGILTKKDWRPSAIERDFIDTVCRKYASLSE